MIDDDKNFKLKNSIEKIINSEIILKFIFDFCDIEDILSLSLVSKNFNNITKSLDYKFEEAIEKNYFSNYNNYE
jgi:hypothetical protein